MIEPAPEIVSILIDSKAKRLIINGLGAEDAARLGAALGALATTTLDTFNGPDDPATAWEMAGLRMPR